MRYYEQLKSLTFTDAASAFVSSNNRDNIIVVQVVHRC